MGIHKQYQAEVFNMAKEIIIDESRGFQGVWIPKNLYTTNKFSLRTKFFLIEVKSLSKNGYCYATDKHFSEFLGISVRMVQNMINDLKKCNYIRTEYEYDGNTKAIKRRFLILTQVFYNEFYNETEENNGIEKNFSRGTEKNCGDKYNNNKYNSINSSTELNNSDFDFEILQKANKLTDDETIIEAIKYYLDKYKRFTGKNHPNVSKAALNVIIYNIQTVLHDEWDDVVNEDGLERMISRHFKTDYGQAIDYNIVHFGSEKVLEYQARNVGLITGWRE